MALDYHKFMDFNFQHGTLIKLITWKNNNNRQTWFKKKMIKVMSYLLISS